MFGQFTDSQYATQLQFCGSEKNKTESHSDSVLFFVECNGAFVSYAKKGLKIL